MYETEMFSHKSIHCQLHGLLTFSQYRQQRVVVDGIVTNYLDINRGVPQGTVFGPILFSNMVNDIKPIDHKKELIKFADDMTLGVLGTNEGDTHLELK